MYHATGVRDNELFKIFELSLLWQTYIPYIQYSALHQLFYFRSLFLGDVGGRSVEEATKRVLSFILTSELALKFNFVGRHGKLQFGTFGNIWEITSLHSTQVCDLFL